MDKKHRQYSIVIHNVRPNSKPQAEAYIQAKTVQHVTSVEAYPHQSGHHLHMFVQYPNQRAKRAVLKELERWKSVVIDPHAKPHTCEDGTLAYPWRVQAEPMLGRFDQCHSYLLGETKYKPTGEVSHNYKTKCYYPVTTHGGKYTVCRWCNQRTCLGQCCKGCHRCQKRIMSNFVYYLLALFTYPYLDPQDKIMFQIDHYLK